MLVLDEPLNGADPVQRVALIDLFQRLGDQGRTVIVSSHVLHEVERLAARQIVLIRGRLAAAGDHRAIRDALADRPRSVQRVPGWRGARPRRPAAAHQDDLARGQPLHLVQHVRADDHRPALACPAAGTGR